MACSTVLLQCCLGCPCHSSFVAALLASVSENPKIKDFVSYGWSEDFDLCNGPQSAETFWTGIECLDPILRPGVISKM
jgi:hypothetical protein